MKKASRLLILLLVLSALLIGCGDSGNGKTTDTAGSTHDLDTDGGDRPTSIYFKTLDEVLSFMNDSGEVGYHHNYVIEHSKSIGYTYSVESSNHEFILVGITPYQTRSADGGIVFDTPFEEKTYEYTYCVRVLIKDVTAEYSGDLVDYCRERFRQFNDLREECIYRIFTAQNGLGDFYVAFQGEGDFCAFGEIDNNYYMTILIRVNTPDLDIFDHETHMDALEEFVNSLTITKIPL